MADSAKSYAKSVLDGYAGTLKRLKERYTSVVGTIDREHDMKNALIEEAGNKKKNVADASNKVSLLNTKRELLDKGLSRSGESVQSELDHSLMRGNAFSAIDENTSAEKRANEKSRADAKASAFADYLDSVNDAELKMNSDYISQLNADREYDAERDDEKHRRYVENREYEAERDDEAYDRYVDNRDYEAERDDEKHRRYVENRKYEAERDDEEYERYADNRDYQAERDDEKYERYADNRDYEAKSDNASGSGASKEKEEDDRIEPKISPKDFVDKIKMVYTSKSFPSDEKRRETIRLKIKAIVDDPTLTYSYRHQVKLYAQSIGLY